MAAISNQQISNESFSHGRLSGMKKPWDFLEESLSSSFDGSSFIEVDPDFFSMRWTDPKHSDFNPPVKGEADSSSATTPSSDSASQSKSWPDSVSADSSPSLRSPDSMPPGSRGGKQSPKSPVKILRKCLYCLVPLYWKVKRLKMTSLKARSSSGSPRSSPWRSGASPILERRRGSRVFDAEPASSIHDAVLHCKKSIATA